MKKADFIIIAAVLAVAGVLTFFLYFVNSDSGAYVQVEVDGAVVDTVALDTDYTKEYNFDGNSVEYYTRDECADEDLVELHFASGHVVAVFNELDEIETLVDDCICRYFKED